MKTSDRDRKQRLKMQLAVMDLVMTLNCPQCNALPGQVCDRWEWEGAWPHPDRVRLAYDEMRARGRRKAS